MCAQPFSVDIRRRIVSAGELDGDVGDGMRGLQVARVCISPGRPQAVVPFDPRTTEVHPSILMEARQLSVDVSHVRGLRVAEHHLLDVMPIREAKSVHAVAGHGSSFVVSSLRQV